MDFILAMIAYFGFNFIPMGWALCDGHTLSVGQNSALFSLLGYLYGGDGVNNFGLPDLRGRVILGQGTSSIGTHTSYSMGNNTTGVEFLNLTVNQMPIHTHTASIGTASTTIKANSAMGTSAGPTTRANVIATVSNGFLYNGNAPDTTLNVGGGAVTGTVTVGFNGGSAPVSVMQPYCVMNACICTNGIYPTRD